MDQDSNWVTIDQGWKAMRHIAHNFTYFERKEFVILYETDRYGVLFGARMRIYVESMRTIQTLLDNDDVCEVIRWHDIQARVFRYRGLLPGMGYPIAETTIPVTNSYVKCCQT